MLTKRQNLIETIRGGNPDRFVNQYEALKLMRGTPVSKKYPAAVCGGPRIVNGWGVTIEYPTNTPGPFPVHDDEHKVIKDIEHWRDYVKAPEVIYPAEAWADIISESEKVDRNEYFVTHMVAPGIFEQCHYLMSIMDCMVAFYENPNEMHELIDYITDWELRYAEETCKYLKPDALFHHDDWGSMNSSFLSPEMFAEFILPAYKKVYGYYKSNGVELIIHHSDSYAANLVPAMIEMGVDIWQGCSTTNNVPELIKTYGGKISFMGNVDNGVVDREGWNKEQIYNEFHRACTTCGKRFFIPCLTIGGPRSTYSGVYDASSEAIERLSREMF